MHSLQLQDSSLKLITPFFPVLAFHLATIYENIISLHVSLTFGTVCQTVLWMSVL